MADDNLTVFKNKLLTKVDVPLNHRYISIHAIYSSNSWPTEYHTHYIVIHIGGPMVPMLMNVKL